MLTISTTVLSYIRSIRYTIYRQIRGVRVGKENLYMVLGLKMVFLLLKSG